MSQFHIIRDAKKLNESLSKQKTARDSYHRLLHVNAVSVLVRTNASGSISEINRFYGLLTGNEQSAFRTYVRLFQETGVKDSDGKPVLTNMAFLKFQGGEFRIDTATPVENRREDSPFQAYAEKVLINPDGKTSKPFYERNNLSDMTLFDDLSIADGIKRMLTTVTNGDTDKRKVEVTAEWTEFLQKVAKDAEALSAKTKATERHKSNVISLHGRAHEKPENVEAAAEKRTTPDRKRAAANKEAKIAATG